MDRVVCNRRIWMMKNGYWDALIHCALFKDVDRNVMRTFACIKRLEERTRNTLELYRIKRKHKKDNIDAPSHNIDPIQLHKRQERCRVHRWCDESTRTWLSITASYIINTHLKAVCLLQLDCLLLIDFGSSYCYKKSEPFSCIQKAFDYHDCYMRVIERRSCCFDWICA